jgi:hypothetical protein
MRVTFICMRAEERDEWHPGRVVHSARLVPVVDGAPEAREQFLEPPSGAIELDGMSAEHFTVGHSYSVQFEQLLPESARHPRRNGAQAERE